MALVGGVRLSRFYNYETPDYLPAPVGGWNPDAQPWELLTTQAPQLDNFLIQPGKIVARGPMVVTADLSSWKPLNVCGVAMTSNGALVGRKDAAAAGQIDYWNAPLLSAAATDLGSGLLTGLWVVGNTVSSYTLPSQDYVPGPRWINFDGLTYGLSYSSATQIHDAQSNYYVPATRLCTLTRAVPGGQPSKAATVYSNYGGGNAWSDPSNPTAPPYTATSALQSQSKTATSVLNWEGGGGYNWTYDSTRQIWTINMPSGVTGYTNHLAYTGFGFSIPANAAIQSITITVNQSCADGTFDDQPELLILNGQVASGAIGGGAAVPAGDPDHLYPYTESVNAPGWTPANINNNSFGFLYQLYATNESFGFGGYAMVSNATVTVYYLTPEYTTDLTSSTYGFALPNNAVVQGIAVTVTRYTDRPGYTWDANCQIIKGGAIVGPSRSTGAGVPGSWGAITFGGSTDLWGQTWTYSDINAAGFGACYQALSYSKTYVSSIAITVYWTTGAAVTVNSQTVVPAGGFDIVGYQSRIWMLGGADVPGGATTHDPIALYFTNPIAAGGGMVAADWKDPVSGLTNKIVMDGDAADYGVGLAVIRNGMLIFRRGSIYLLRGTTTANYQLAPLSQDVGCVDARSIIESDQGAYFVSQEGLMLCNGTTITNVSSTVLHTLQSAVEAEQASVIAGRGGYVTCGRTSRGQIIISVGIGAATAGSIAPIFTAMYDPNVNAWTRLTSDLWASDGTQASGNNYCGQIYDYTVPKRLLAFGDQYVTAIQDQAVGKSMLDFNAGLYDQLPSGANPYLAIPAVWKTLPPGVITASRRAFSQAKRYYLDYMFTAQNLTPTTGWTIQPLDTAGAQLDDRQDAPIASPPTLSGFVSNVTPVPGEFIKRLNRDWTSEVDDFMFVVTWQDIARAQQAGSSVAELYGVGLEFQPGRDLR